MQKSNMVYKDCQKSDYWLASKMHWSFPFEIMYLQKDKYMSFANLSESDKIKHYNNIIASFNDPDNYIANIIKVFYSTIVTTSNTSSEQFYIETRLLDDYKTMLISEIKPKKYDEFLRKSIHTIDVYGLGMTLMHMLNHTKHLINSALYIRFNELFYNMVTPNLFKRFGIKEAIAEYKEILKGQEISDDIKSLTPNTHKSEMLLTAKQATILKSRYTLKRSPKRAA